MSPPALAFGLTALMGMLSLGCGNRTENPIKDGAAETGGADGSPAGTGGAGAGGSSAGTSGAGGDATPTGSGGVGAGGSFAGSGGVAVGGGAGWGGSLVDASADARGDSGAPDRDDDADARGTIIEGHR